MHMIAYTLYTLIPTHLPGVHQMLREEGCLPVQPGQDKGGRTPVPVQGVRARLHAQAAADGSYRKGRGAGGPAAGGRH